MEEHIEATAIINHCHLPLDVTFLVSFQYGNSTKHSWKYTFVTANQNERIPIPGLLLPPAPHAPVFLYARIPEREFNMHNSSFVAIEASFVAELKTQEWEEAEFLNHTIFIDTTEDCRFMKVGRDPIPWIVGGLFLVAILTGLVGGGCYLYRKKKLEIDQLALVTSMEVGLPGAQPYQMDAVNEKPEEQKPDVPVNDTEQTGSGNIEGENTDSTVIDMNSNEDVTDTGKNFGFSFGRLKEEREPVVIGNPTFQEDKSSSPSRKIKKRKSSRRHPNGGPPPEVSVKNIANDVIPETCPEKDFINGSLESEGSKNQISMDNDPSGMTEHPLEDSSDDGMPVGQGARRKVRGMVSSTITGTPTVVASDVHETNNDSQKCL
ncbi:uncharacterized protein [Palaemon carinicauda]|uniref:uncharacterized protein isoform X2 n=1 Tax=Palaemon carinicauda TaxID=392227 RepID=UPI0035B59DCF